MDTDEFLEHYGVKGMKWGIRKDRNLSSKDDKQTEEKKQFTKKQVVIGASVLLGVAATAVLLSKHGDIKTSVMSKGFSESALKNQRDQVDRLLAVHGNTTDVVLPKGHIFSRISNVAEKEIRQGAYAVDDAFDVANYKSFWQSPDRRHQVKIKAVSDIKLPSLETRFKIMGEVMDEPSAELGGKTLRQYIRNQQGSRKAKYWVKKAPTEELARLKYAEISGGNWSKGVGKVFADRLIEKGYGAMSDDTDSTNNLAKAPKVLLNKGLFEIVSSEKLSSQEIDSAYRDFKEFMKTAGPDVNWPMPEYNK